MHPVAPCACLESRFPSVTRAEDGLLGWKNVLQPLTISGLRVSASRDAVGLRYNAPGSCAASGGAAGRRALTLIRVMRNIAPITTDRVCYS